MVIAFIVHDTGTKIENNRTGIDVPVETSDETLIGNKNYPTRRRYRPVGE